jgi:hypothetical protein
MAIVWQTPLGVDQYARAGRSLEVPRFACPGCGEQMGYWGWYSRDLRWGECRTLLVRRQRCKPCASAHAVLPGFMAHGRLDAVGVIGPALEAMAALPGSGPGFARAVDVPVTTVRDWRRRFEARAGLLAKGFARTCVALGDLVPRLHGSPAAVALGALRSAWRAALRRSGRAAGRLWRFANAVVGGHLLTTNTDPPWSTK